MDNHGAIERLALPIVVKASTTDTTTDILSNTPLGCLYYLGETGSGATFEITSGGDWVFTTDGTTADTTVNATGTIDCSTAPAGNNIYGELIQLINASPNWKFIPLAVINEYLVENTAETQAEIDMSTAAMKKSGWFVFRDSSVADGTYGKIASVCISGFSNDVNTPKLLADDLCINWVNYITAICNFDSGAALVKVYTCPALGTGSSVLLYTGAALTTDTLATFGSNGEDGFMPSKYGERLVISIEASADLDSYTLTAIGKCYDLHGKNVKAGYSVTNAPTA